MGTTSSSSASGVRAIAEQKPEQVSVFYDQETGVYAVIAVHDTTLGPGLGGCRMKSYPGLGEAIEDAVLLAEGMSYKNALAGLNFGGGKSVLAVDRSLSGAKREKLLLNFGGFVHSLNGRYITAEDMGTGVSDMEIVLSATPHVAGRDPANGGGGDPSPWTALGVFESIRACLERVYGSGDFSGKTVAIQGVGRVGSHLAEHLAKAGAKLIFADARRDHLESMARKFNASTVDVEEIFSVDCDVFSPCAGSHVLNSRTIPELRAKIVAGSANIQLERPEFEETLRNRGIVYAPDFVINSGGVILCADELEPGGFTESRVRGRVGQIYNTLGRIFDAAQDSGELPGIAAIRLAKERISKAREEKQAKG